MRAGIVLIVISVLAACRSTRPIQTAITKRDTTQQVIANGPDSVARITMVLAALDSNRIPFETFTSKVNVDYRSGDGKNYDVNATIRMQRDRAIWISVNAVLGIEALRVLITPDSVKLLDKLNKTYTARKSSYLQEVTSLPLDLPTLQNLLIGNAVFTDSNIVSLTQTGTTTSLLMLGPLFKNLITLNSSDNTLLHSKLDDVNTTRNRTADLAYSDYETGNGKPFATKRIISISEKKKLDINLNFKQYDFNTDVSFPFSVPKNFTTR